MYVCLKTSSLENLKFEKVMPPRGFTNIISLHNSVLFGYNATNNVSFKQNIMIFFNLVLLVWFSFIRISVCEELPATCAVWPISDILPAVVWWRS